MGDWLLKLGIGKLAAALDGYKLYIFGAAWIMKGLLEIVGIYWPDSGFPSCDIKTATDDIMIGLSIMAGKSAIKKAEPNK